MARLPFRWTPRREVELFLDDEEDAAERMPLEPAAREDEGDEQGFIGVSGGTWERRLSRREKVLRGAGSVAAALIVVLILVGGPGAVLAYLAKATQTFTPAPIAQAAAQPPSNALDVPVPASIAANPQVQLSPVNGADEVAYACWVDETASNFGVQMATLHVGEYAIASHNWTLLPQPVAQSAGCTVVTDTTAPGNIVLALTRVVAEGSACQLPDLYRSADGGAHWASLPWPSGALAPCNVQFAMEGGRLYVQSGSRLLPAGDAESAGLISVTSDGGATWAAADDGLAGLSRVALVALRPGGRLLAQGVDPLRQNSTTLWQSDDAGAHWRFMMEVPGAQPHVYASSDPEATANGGWGRLYDYAGSNASSASSGLTLRGLLNQGGGTGATLATSFADPAWTLSPLQLNGMAVPAWTSVALEPDAANKDQRPTGAWQVEAGEGPSSAMMFTQPNASGNPTNIVAPFNLVVWNGQAWSQLAQLIPANATLQGISWNGGVMRLWFTHKTSVLRPIELFTYTISPDDVR